MALSKNATKVAASAAPAASTAAQTPGVPDEVKVPDPVVVDKDGAQVNDGDANTQPSGQRPVTPSAIENDATPKQTADQQTSEALAVAKAKALESGEPFEADDVEKRVKVLNKRDVAFRQPSSGTWIPAGGVAYVINDGWLTNQINAGLFEITKKAVTE